MLRLIVGSIVGVLGALLLTGVVAAATPGPRMLAGAKSGAPQSNGTRSNGIAVSLAHSDDITDTDDLTETDEISETHHITDTEDINENHVSSARLSFLSKLARSGRTSGVSSSASDGKGAQLTQNRRAKAVSKRLSLFSNRRNHRSAFSFRSHR